MIKNRKNEFYSTIDLIIMNENNCNIVRLSICSLISSCSIFVYAKVKKNMLP